MVGTAATSILRLRGFNSQELMSATTCVFCQSLLGVAVKCLQCTIVQCAMCFTLGWTVEIPVDCIDALDSFHGRALCRF